jgi:3-hydroxyisobutyrate dehydrogenase-like beta-hydroxyacid dehydrogenase
MDIGFIGLGNMGAHMARRLLEAGHKVVVYDTRQEAIGNPPHWVQLPPARRPKSPTPPKS